ncbi:MAG: S-methyl-5-thioribose kinase [Verrucomicrobia bacterium]|nr:S-methyl-5-thioribose kinase [Verrucomicrobiota bacterium]MDA1065338.1 S-methyl-5-thioribose kinase [Verrucomicrobiota bacterium]
MSYEILTPETLVDYLKSIEAMQSLFSSFDNLEVIEVGDGNLNYVYLITNRDNLAETVALKQAVPYLRVVGESWALTRERMRFEIQALEIQKELCPDFVPEIFYSSIEMSVVIMQNLSNQKILRGQIIEGKVFPYLADHMSTFLAHTLYYTSDWYLSSADKKKAVANFINAELCNLTEEFVFTNPFEKHETNSYNEALSEEDIDFIQKDGTLKIAVAEMKYKFMNHTEALLHGDLHIGSVMANENETTVIDPEFAFYGPMGFDIGAFIGNLFMSYFSHEYRQKLLGREPLEYRSWILDTIASTWNQFESKFDQLWEKHQHDKDPLYFDYAEGKADARRQRQSFLKHVFSDTLGFAACKMMRRIVGLAKVGDIADIEDLKERAHIERMTLELGKALVIQRDQFKSIEEVIDRAKTISPLR